MAIQIQVKLDPTATPPVTLIPKNQAVNRGNESIEWTPFASESFTFKSLTGLPNPPFSNLSVTNSMVTVTDNNTGAGDYPYTIVVTLNGTDYSSAEQFRRHPVPGPSGTDPTIKNN